MPNHKSHIFFGFLLLIVFLFLEKINSESLIVYVLITLFYSLLPDIDIAHSKLGKAVRIFLLVAALIAFIFEKKLLVITSLVLVIILSLLKHRGIIHSFRASVLLSLPLLLIGFQEFLLGLLLYNLHLILDKDFKL